MVKYDIFLSYSRKDLNTIRTFISKLESKGFNVWMDLSNIDYGMSFPDKIAEAIDNSDSLLFMCTANSLAAPYCKKELGYARSNGKKIRVVLVDGTMPKKGWFALDYQDINCVNIKKVEQEQKLFDELESAYPGRTPGPSGPIDPIEPENDKVFNSLTKAGFVAQYVIFGVLGLISLWITFNSLGALSMGKSIFPPILDAMIVCSIIATYYLSKGKKNAFYAICLLDFIETYLVYRMGYTAYLKHPEGGYSTAIYANLWGVGAFVRWKGGIITYFILSIATFMHVAVMRVLLNLQNDKGNSGWSLLR